MHLKLYKSHQFVFVFFFVVFLFFFNSYVKYKSELKKDEVRAYTCK